MAAPGVVFYTTSTPSTAKQRTEVSRFKQLLDSKKVAYKEVDLADNPSAQEAMWAAAGDCKAIPQLHANGKAAGGRLRHGARDGGLWRARRGAQGHMMGTTTVCGDCALAAPPTGPSLGEELLAGSELEEVLDALAAEGGRVCCTLLLRSLDGGPEAARALAVVRETSWEKLHTGPWRAVPPAWRDAYGLACLLEADALLRQAGGGVGQHAAREAVRLADMCLLMGGARLRARAHALAASGVALLDSSGGDGGVEEAVPSPPYKRARASAAGCASVSTALPTAEPPWPDTWPLPPHPVPLPPGSLGPAPGSRVPVSALPSLAAFAADHVAAPGGGAPVVLTGALASWPALARWQSPAYLVRVAGWRTVPVEVGAHYLAPGWGQGLMTLGAFLRRHVLGRAGGGRPDGGPGGQDGGADGPRGLGGGSSSLANPVPVGYLAQHALLDQVPLLAADVATPDYVSLGELAAVNAWLGPGGTHSPAHTDPHHNLLCQAVGRKYVRLYPPAAGRSLAPDPAAAGLTTNTSPVDLDDVIPRPAPCPPGNADPGTEPFQDCVLGPGDALFIPRGWWHAVRALEPSFSVSYWWD